MGKLWKSVWYVILDIDQRIRPTVVQTGANVTLEDFENTFHQVVGKAQQLFAYPVSDKTVPNKFKVLFATMAISVTAYVKLVKTQFDLW